MAFLSLLSNFFGLIWGDVKDATLVDDDGGAEGRGVELEDDSDI